MKEQKHTICRACHAGCGLVVDFEDGVPVATHGVKDNPAFYGYSCIKGRRLADQHSFESRLIRSQKKQDDGAFADIDWRQAAAESAERIQQIIDQHGPDSVAMFIGTFGFLNFPSHAFSLAFMEAIGSNMVFNTATIDQPGKAIAGAEHGTWLAGPYRVSEWDGLMLVGTNPPVSQSGGLGPNPARNLHQRKKDGMELIVIDPRVTDSAKKADLHLKCRPGEDTAVLAAIAHQLIQDDAIDHEFVAQNAEGLEALKAAVAPFDAETAAKRAGVDADDIIRAARMFAKWQRGHVAVGTGPNMSGFGNIIEYLNLVLTTLRGHWRREGETRPNEGVFIKPAPAIAAGSGAMPVTGFGKKLRVRGLQQSVAGLPTAALAEEILTPGEGQIKALIVIGGNPVLSWPDQIKTVEAMKSLDLLVCIDPRMSKTAQYADYVIAPKLPYETHGTSGPVEFYGVFGAGWGFDKPYGQVCKPIMAEPQGSDLCEEYQFFHAMASHLHKPLSIKSFALLTDPQARNQQQTLVEPGQEIEPIAAWEAALRGSPVAVTEAFTDQQAYQGKLFDREPAVVQPKPDGWTANLVIGAPGMLAELDRYRDERLRQPYPDQDEGGYPFKLISRRLHDVYNSNWHEDTTLRKRLTH
ncbi:MAG: molybdopterin-containing oxidoreductase family protein, partial [bacterium]